MRRDEALRSGRFRPENACVSQPTRRSNRHEKTLEIRRAAGRHALVRARRARGDVGQSLRAEEPVRREEPLRREEVI